jgi:uncharacterized protein
LAFREPPRYAAWQHREARTGFEVAFLAFEGDGRRLDGDTAAVEEGEAWAVRYVLALDSGWSTRRADVWGLSASGAHDLTLEADGAGGWRINGSPAPDLEGCLDVDLESSSLTNAFPIHRLDLEVGHGRDAPAAYVRAPDLKVERLEQRYVRLEDDGTRERYRYTAAQFGFECEITYDEFGLVLEYPGIAARIA